MKTLLNVVWFVLAGWWLALGYAVAGLLMLLTVIGVPFGLQSFKLANYALWPFGRAVIRSPDRDVALSTLGNLLWFMLGGLWLALAHVVAGLMLCVTVVGIPLGLGSFKMAGLALVPFGKQIVPVDEIPPGTATIVVIG